MSLTDRFVVGSNYCRRGHTCPRPLNAGGTPQAQRPYHNKQVFTVEVFPTEKRGRRPIVVSLQNPMLEKQMNERMILMNIA